MRTAAVLPVKRFALAKQRLGASVADPLRLELARAMVADVLSALAATASIELTIVVTSEQSVALAATELHALVLEDLAEQGQSAAATLGIRRASEQGFSRVLCVPGDCPALDPLELEGLLGVPAEDPAVVILPDRHGSGTNGLLLSPPDAIAPSFGPDSCDRHRALALAGGVPCRVERLPSLLLDVDTGEDLAALTRRLSGERAGAPQGAARTRAVLDRAGHSEAISITTTA
jgi:2-phospho-L-lactate/phosphoenolpyruvate guanylyltransferase